jgi:EAL domain-containing protein (putative c-di-GMP-specific phosphodiesterase class I)
MAIDDFGAGHSSLSRLRDLPVELLKLDGTFLCDTPDDVRAVRLVVAALGLAHALGMHTIVEGVETAAQVDFLHDEHAELLQGFHFARPMAASALDRMLQRAPA